MTIYTPGMIAAPSHLLQAQAAQILGWSKQRVNYHARPGGTLEAETWWGIPMIPAAKVAAELKKRMEVQR